MNPPRDAINRLRRTVEVSGPRWAATLVVDELAPLGLTRLWAPWRVSLERLGAQLRSVMVRWEMPAGQVDAVVRQMLHADRHGVDTHGSAALLAYHRLLLAGDIRADPEVEIVRDEAGTALVDGGGGLGHPPAELAMELAIERATRLGVAAVSVRNSGHFGAAGGYALMAAEQGLIGIATTSTARVAMIPAGGTEARLGTNPIAFAAPGGAGRPFLLDMSTSTVPIGQLAAATRGSGRIPRGWAIDRNGRHVRSARRALRQRRLTPLGGTAPMSAHKGYGLAAMVQILAALVPGATPGTAEADSSIGHLMIAIDPGRLREDGGFGTDLDQLLAALRSTPAADPEVPVMVAGDPEWAAAAERDRLGIPLARGVVEDIRTVARSTGVPFELEPM